MRKPTIIAGLATATVLAVGGGAAFAASKTPTPSTTTTSSENRTSTTAPSVPREQAEKTALEKVPGGKLTSTESTELETENGKQVWEVEVTAPDGVEHEISVDAAKGVVVSEEVEDDDRSGTEHDDD